jgi:hypothetical protein
MISAQQKNNVAVDTIAAGDHDHKVEYVEGGNAGTRVAWGPASEAHSGPWLGRGRASQPPS